MVRMPCRYLRVRVGRHSDSATHLLCSLRKNWCRTTRMLQCPDYVELSPVDLQPFKLLWSSLRGNTRARYLNRLPYLQRWVNEDLEVVSNRI